MLVPSDSESTIPEPTPVIRTMQDAELEAVANVFAKAFFHDSSTAYVFGLERPPPNVGNINDPDGLRLLRRTRRYNRTLLSTIRRSGGEIDVVVVPGEDNGPECIVGAAAWLKPGGTRDPLVLNALFPGTARVLVNLLRSLGPSGLKRELKDYGSKLGRATEAVFRAHCRDQSDSWYLYRIGIDPESTGKGYGSLLMRYGFQRASSMPIHLEATSAKSRDIYFRLGFVVETECRFGVGEVTSQGIKAKGQEEADGHIEWIMVKWGA